MKLGKMTMTALAFAVGACVFVTTAFADMALGSGYDRLKGAIKHTAEQMEEELDNYTVEILLEVKMDDETLMQETTVNKYDTKKKAMEDVNVSKGLGRETHTRWSYFDPEVYIYKYDNDDKYYVVERNHDLGDDAYVFNNPFEDEWSEDVEKIIDALVGNLKEYVQVEDTADGGRLYSGSLSQMQVPTLFNAVSSFYIKLIFNEQFWSKDTKVPLLKKDVFVQKITGSAVEDENGLLRSLVGEFVFSGKDDNDDTHQVTLNIAFKLTDVGNTKVVKPDLAGKTVEFSAANGFTEKYVGTYKNSIVVEKDGSYEKIGERTLVIESVQEGVIKGRFYETVKPEFAADYPEPYDFTFELTTRDEFFKYVNPAGEEETGILFPAGNGNVYIDLNLEVQENGGYVSGGDERSGDMIRVFEE